MAVRRRWNLRSRPWAAAQQFLRTAGPGTLLAAGALIVSVGAFATVIGIGEIQIGSAKGGSGDLWHDWWFVLGVIGAGAGVLVLLLAVASSGIQARSRKRFPDVGIYIMEVRNIFGSPGSLPPNELTGRTVTLRVHNREISRNASLGFVLVGELDRALPHGGTDFGFMSREQAPWNVGPGLTEHQTIGFELRIPDGFNLVGRPDRINVLDIASGKSVSLGIGTFFFDKTNWQAL